MIDQGHKVLDVSQIPLDKMEGRFVSFQRFWAVLALVLFGTAGRMWFPPQALPQLPQIPVFESLCHVYGVLDWILLVSIMSGLSTVLWTRYSVAGLWVFAIAAMCSVLLNQHRLQPWVYQFIIYAVVMASFRTRDALQWMRWVAISIYIYSAISKFDYQFQETLGVDFLKTLTGLGGLDATTLPRWLAQGLILLFPSIELFAAVGLMFDRTRRIGAAMIMTMHFVLLLILGPWGLRHHSGVLIWNLFLMGQAFFFWFLVPHHQRLAVPSNRRVVPMVERVAFFGVVFVLAFPLTASISLCDHWLAWQVYAPRTSRAKLEIASQDVKKLPLAIVPFLAAETAADGFRSFDLNRWSLTTAGVPIYPEDRFQFGLAAELVRQCNLENFRIDVAGESDRWTGVREWRVVDRQDELERIAIQFRLNTRARSSNVH